MLRFPRLGFCGDPSFEGYKVGLSMQIKVDGTPLVHIIEPYRITSKRLTSRYRQAGSGMA